MSEASNTPSVPHGDPVVNVGYMCAHHWVHMPERDWEDGLQGRRVKLLFYCDQCLRVETRVVER